MTSAKLTPAARTAIRTCPGPQRGAGRSCTASAEASPCSVMTTARMPATLRRRGARPLALEHPGGRELAAAAEELRVARCPPDDHEHRPEEQEAEPDDQRRPEPEDGRRSRVGPGQVDAGLHEQPEQHQPAE